MSVHTIPLPPVSKLHDDLLYEIFFLNTCRGPILQWNPNEYLDQSEISESPPEATRRASQVCRSWREILLHSPSIWARCMTLEALDQRDSRWRNHVLQRTGQSVLTITARQIMLPDSALSLFLENLLDTQWTRVGELYLTTTNSILRSTRISGAFLRPAPNLKVFITRPTGGWLQLNLPLFSGNAPSLEYLCLLGINNSGIDIRSPAMFTNNMRHLEFSQQTDLHVNELIAACLRMPLLEHLKINVPNLTVNGLPDADLPSRVSMPRLRFVGICCPILDIYPLFMDRVAASIDCELSNIHILDPRVEGESAESLQCMDRVLSKYANSAFIHHQGQSNTGETFLHIAPMRFHFACYGKRFQIYVGNSTVNTVARLLDTIQTFVYASTPGKLELFVSLPDDVHPQAPHWRRVHAEAKLTQTLKSMRAIHTLQICDDHLSTLHRISGAEILFPRLKILDIRGGNHNFDLESKVLQFLAQRYAVAPVAVLRIKINEQDDIPWVEIHSMDDLTGLTISWERYGRGFQYICGGEKLQLGL
ncbi:hypothetical protein HYPSUDRAFT_38813 [Hypholoma sublateritium FD-334 SS-4]|uniref:Uncharacterized protein n=1 Tax=Hypholoma sublateritium (strain FD-334 SS-4) TaxID=945553 RepID=A0A0D2P0B5_HYPSF|nr:hypothetical protein HYPSUDRAFT_38813 [Hypholoma sublateritium FD-334 SS-4]